MESQSARYSTMNIIFIVSPTAPQVHILRSTVFHVQKNREILPNNERAILTLAL